MADYINGADLEFLTFYSVPPYVVPLGSTFIPTPLDEMRNQFPDDEHIGPDTPYDTGLILAYPSIYGASDTVTFESQWLPVDSDTRHNQTRLKSGSGIISIYSSGHKDRIYEIKLNHVPMEKIERLYIFLNNIIEGAKRTFEILDESGTVYTVKWWDENFPRSMRWWMKHEIVLHFLVIRTESL